MGERTILIRIFKNFINSFRPRQIRGDVVGKDHFGTTYFQILKSNRQRGERWFEPKEKDDFDQEIPAEWEAWLRYRRKDPPSEQEVLANYELAKQKKINADKLEADRKPKELPDSAATETRGYSSFPQYEEYERTPGEHLMKKRPK